MVAEEHRGQDRSAKAASSRFGTVDQFVRVRVRDLAEPEPEGEEGGQVSGRAEAVRPGEGVERGNGKHHVDRRKGVRKPACRGGVGRRCGRGAVEGGELVHQTGEDGEVGKGGQRKDPPRKAVASSSGTGANAAMA